MHHKYKNNDTEKQYRWNHFQSDFLFFFLQQMNDKNIDSQPEYNIH